MLYEVGANFKGEEKEMIEICKECKHDKKEHEKGECEYVYTKLCCRCDKFKEEKNEEVR